MREDEPARADSLGQDGGHTAPGRGAARPSRGGPVNLGEERRKRRGEEAERFDLDPVSANDYAFDPGDTGLVDGLIPRDGQTMLYGKSGCYKTFGTIDLAARIFLGWPWRDRATDQRPVAYLAAEDPESVRFRFAGWRKRYAREEEPGRLVLPDLGGLPIIRAPLDLARQPVQVRAVTGFLAHLADDHGKAPVVFIDTVAAAMTGDENTSEGMGAMLHAVQEISHKSGAHVVLVHHEGKEDNKGPRGWSGSGCRMTCVAQFEKAGDRLCKVTFEKVRDGSAAEFWFRLATVEMGMSQTGRTISTLTPEPLDHVPAGVVKPAKPSKPAAVAMKALGRALDRGGSKPPPVEQWGGVAQVAPLDLWREHFRKLTAYSDDAKGREAERKAWDRARMAALEEGLAGVQDGLAYRLGSTNA